MGDQPTICIGPGSGSIIFDYQSIVDLVANDLKHLSNFGIINTIPYDPI